MEDGVNITFKTTIHKEQISLEGKPLRKCCFLSVEIRRLTSKDARNYISTFVTSIISIIQSVTLRWSFVKNVYRC